MDSSYPIEYTLARRWRQIPPRRRKHLNKRHVALWKLVGHGSTVQASGMHYLSPIQIWRLRGKSLYVYSISVALQAITVISMGGIADHRKFHWKLIENMTWEELKFEYSSPSQTGASKLCNPWFNGSYLLPVFTIFISCLVPLSSTGHTCECGIRSFCCSHECLYPGFSSRISRSRTNFG